MTKEDLDRAQANAGKENCRILNDAHETLKLFTTCDIGGLADREVRARRSMINDSMGSLVQAIGSLSSPTGRKIARKAHADLGDRLRRFDRALAARG